MKLRFCLSLICILLLNIKAVEGSSIETPISSVQFQKIDSRLELPKEAPTYIFRNSDSSQWFFYSDKLVRRQGNLTEEKSYPEGTIKKFTDYIRIEAKEFDKLVIFSIDDHLFSVHPKTLKIDLLESFSKTKEIITGIELITGQRLLLTTQNHVYVKSSLNDKAKKLDLDEELLQGKLKFIYPFATTSENPNTVWIGSFLGIIYKVSSISEGVPKLEKFVLPIKGRHAIYSVKDAGNDSVFIGASSGLYRFNVEKNEVVKLGKEQGFSNVVNLINHNEKLWFLSDGKLVVYDILTEAFTIVDGPGSFGDDSAIVKHMSKDKEGLLWMSVQDKGGYSYSVRKNNLQPLKKNIYDSDKSSVRFVKSIDDILIIGTGHYTRFHASDSIKDIDVPSTSADKLSGGGIALGGNGKFTTLENGSLKKVEIPALSSQVNNIVEDKVGRLWLTTVDGLAFLYDPNTGQFTNLREALTSSTGNGKFAKLLDDGSILYVTDNEILIINAERELQVIKNIKLDGSLVGYQSLINSVLIFSDNNKVYEFSLSTRELSERKSTKTEQFFCTVESTKGNKWTAIKGSGIKGYSEKYGSNIILSELDGTPEGGFDGNHCVSHLGQPIFSAYGKLYTINQPVEKFEKESLSSKVVIDNLLIKNERVIIEPYDVGELKQSDFPIRFSFYHSHLENSTAVEYSYNIYGLYENWNELGQQSLSIDALPAGDYTVNIRSRISGEEWNKPTKVSFSVLPPVWLSVWAIVFYIVLTIVIGYIFFSFKTKRLRKRSAQLEAVVQQRTAELEEILDKKNTEFVNVSHEFRTPLTLILGPVNNLLNSKVAESSRQTLETVKRNGYRLLRMVDQLLHMEKFRVDHVVAKRPVTLKKVTRRIVEPFIDLAEEKKVTLRIDQIDEATVLFTPDAFEKILLNLLSNAVKYTQAGDQITFSLIVEEKDKVKIIVSDTGIGIPQDKLDSVFERFSRVLDSRTEQVTGAGVGLALVKELVEKHDGTIELSSELNKGTIFTILFPTCSIEPQQDGETPAQINEDFVKLELQSISEQSNEVEKVALNQESNVQDDKVSVLVVEDNPDMRDYIVSTLDSEYRTFVAANGKEGLQLAKELVPDLIVSDVMMPEMDGYELCRRLKDEEVTSHIPLILLTARSDKSSRLEGWKNKADEYLTKPFDSTELNIRIQNLLSIRSLLKNRLLESFASASFAKEPESTSLKTPEVQSQDAVLDDEKQWEENERKFIEKFSAEIEKRIHDSELKVDALAKVMAVSERQLYRKLKGLLNITPAEFLRSQRLIFAIEQLNTGVSVSDVAFNAGFSSQSYFSRCFKAKYGASPSEYQKSRKI